MRNSYMHYTERCADVTTQNISSDRPKYKSAFISFEGSQNIFWLKSVRLMFIFKHIYFYISIGPGVAQACAEYTTFCANKELSLIPG
jgi:hypothetical protein